MVKQSVGHDCTIHLRRNQTTYCWPNCERQHDCKASRYIIGTLTDTWKSQPCVWLGLPYASCNQLSYHLSPSSGPCELSDFTLCKTDYSSAKMMQLRCHVSSELTIFSWADSWVDKSQLSWQTAADRGDRQQLSQHVVAKMTNVISVDNLQLTWQLGYKLQLSLRKMAELSWADTLLLNCPIAAELKEWANRLLQSWHEIGAELMSCRWSMSDDLHDRNARADRLQLNPNRCKAVNHELGCAALSCSAVGSASSTQMGMHWCYVRLQAALEMEYAT